MSGPRRPGVTLVAVPLLVAIAVALLLRACAIRESEAPGRTTATGISHSSPPGGVVHSPDGAASPRAIGSPLDASEPLVQPPYVAPPAGTADRQSISGRAVDAESGSPAGGVPFRWLPIEGSSESDESNLGVTASDGTFETAPLESAPYAIEFSGYSSRSQSPWIRLRLDPVHPGSRGVLVSLRRGFTIFIKVVDDAGRAVPRVGLRLERVPAWLDGDYFEARRSSSAADGSALFAGLAAGTYSVIVAEEDPVNRAHTIRALVPSSHRLEVQDSSAHVFTVSPGLRVRGGVVTASGASPAEVSTGGTPRVAVLPAGHFDAEGLDCPHGWPVRLTSHLGWRFESSPLSPGTLSDVVASGFTDGRPVVLRSVPAGAEDVEVRLEHTLPIEGLLLDEAGQAAPEGITVEAHEVSESGNLGRVAITHTDHRGRFLFAGLPTGSYELFIDRPRRAFLPPSQPPRIAAGSTSLVVTMRRGATVSGRVLDHRGLVIREPQVTDEDDRVAQVDPDGRFQFAGLEPGVEIRIRVRLAGGASQEFGPFRAPSSDLTLQIGF